jgi:glycosyltransferase involved in cell wall biosynthesis
MSALKRYVLVTPTKNEEAFIGETIESVVNQTVRPVEWVIVSDGSTDRTNEIVVDATLAHPWIHLVVLPPRQKRDFAAVVHAVEAGVCAITVNAYDYIGLLDSDLSFKPDYFENVMQIFELSPTLGLAGGVVIDPGQSKNRFPRNKEDVPGASQFFRRRCFEHLGGLVAVPEGGWDALTCALARMRGYETRLLMHLVIDHLKPRNVYEGGALRRQWQMGVRDYALGYHPLFEMAKCFSRIFGYPLFVGSVTWWVGYCWSFVRGRERRVPRDLLKFIRIEQKKRLLPKWNSIH